MQHSKWAEDVTSVTLSEKFNVLFCVCCFFFKFYDYLLAWNALP